MFKQLFALVLLVLSGCISASSTPSTNEGEAGAPTDSVGAPGLREPTTAGSVEPEPTTDDRAVCRAAHEPDPALVHWCVLMAACAPSWAHYGGSSIDGNTTSLALSDCIALDLPNSIDVEDCATAATCEELSRCAGTGYYEKQCPLEPERARFCDGSRMVDCLYVLPAQYFDCSSVGGSCIEFDDGSGSQAVDCAVDSPCGDMDDEKFRCDGDKRVQCRGGIAHGEDCAAEDMICSENPDGAECVDPPDATMGECVPNAAQCNDDGSATFCDPYGVLEHVNCPAVGLSCVMNPDSGLLFECRAPDCDAEAESRCVEECAGPFARICLGGSRFTVDCREHGFDYCRPFVGEIGPAAQCAIPLEGGFIIQP
jgi:hypothetical protein